MGASKSKSAENYDETLYVTPIPGVNFMENIVIINGQRRNVARWMPVNKAPKALVLIAHGLHEHALRYYRLAHSLVANGYGVIGIDHVSHGLSDGKRALITDYKILIADFKTFVINSHDEFPDIPVFIFSHSLGTLISSMVLKDVPFVKVHKNLLINSFVQSNCHYINIIA